MAETNEITGLQKVLLGDTTSDAVDKINKGLTKIDTNESAISKNGLDILSLNSAVDDLEDAVENAGKIDKIKLKDEDATYEPEDPDSSKVVELPVYSINRIDELIGNLAGGMRYAGTTEAWTRNTAGTEENPHIIPEGEYKNGDTYKVSSGGIYKYGDQFLWTTIIEGSTYKKGVEVGDLIIFEANSIGGHGGWDVVPSGDDGDVYAEENFTAGRIIVADGSNGKKVRSSEYQIDGGFDSTEDARKKKVPTAQLLYTTVKERFLSLPLSEFSYTESGDYRLYKSNNTYVDVYAPVGIFGSNRQKLIVDMYSIPKTESTTEGQPGMVVQGIVYFGFKIHKDKAFSDLQALYAKIGV